MRNCVWIAAVSVAAASLDANAQQSGPAPAADAAASLAAIDAQAPVAVQPAAAPSASADQAQPGAADSTGIPRKLEEVVVTATKRAQTARDIPSSVNVLTGAKLESIGARKLEDFINLVPGINMQDEIAGEQRKLSVRGVGPDNTTNQTVGVVVGDVAVSDPYGALTIVDPNPWDMRTVEVLKGPQGTLFGATSLAGLLRYVPNEPMLNTWEGKFSAEEVDVHEGGRAPTFSGAVNVPMGNTLALRAAGIWQHAPGLIDIDTPGRHVKDADASFNTSGRVMLRWQPTERFTADAWYSHDSRSADELNYVTNQNAVMVRNDAPDPSPVRNTFGLSTLDLRYRFDWATLVSVTGYQNKTSYNDVDTSYLVEPIAQLGISFLHADRTAATHGLQQEVRLISPDGGRWNWLIGAYYSGYDAHSVSHLYIPSASVATLLSLLPPQLVSGVQGAQGLVLATTGANPLKASEKALFGESNFDLFPKLRLTAGARFYEADVSAVEHTSGASSQANGYSADILEKGFSPKGAITYRPWEDIMIYANATRGFQFGGFNEALVATPGTTVPPTFKSASLWNYEGGMRTDWLHRTLRFDFTLFYLDWKNPQVTQVSSTGLATFVANVGGVHSKGAEMTLRYLTPIRGLSIEEDASWIQARTSEPFNDISGNLVPTGTLMPSSPVLQSTTTLSYKLKLGNWMTDTSLVDSVQGNSWNDIDHDHAVGNYNILNFYFNVARRDLFGEPMLSFSMNNVLDRRAIVSELGGAPTVPGQPGLSAAITPIPTVYNAPRTLSLRLSLQF